MLRNPVSLFGNIAAVEKSFLRCEILALKPFFSKASEKNEGLT